MPFEYEASMNIVGGKALLPSLLLHSATLEVLSLSQEALQILFLWTTASVGLSANEFDKGCVMGALFDIIVHFCSEHSYYILFLYLVSFFLFNDAKSNGSIYMAHEITDNNRNVGFC
jgi:hypothetical protein